MANRSRSGDNYRNPCLTMHQPWASLLVYGIKRIEGRSWPSPITGRLWIHAAGAVPTPETIKAMEDFYREIYAVDGITDLKFPQHYPTSRLLGCVDVVGCVTGEELACWEEVPEGVRLEALTSFCWLCQTPQKLPIPFEMRGAQGVYNLERRIFEAAVRGLRLVEPPMQIKFLLPDPQNRFSLKPGSIASRSNNLSQNEKAPNLSAAIAGARAASTQFSKNSNFHSNSAKESDRWAPVSSSTRSYREDAPVSSRIWRIKEEANKTGQNLH
ncbi:activating signal cointegrator 1 [Impatiens glandulifera]|uniref:activating signal cointegrator 1 n=1 Tax=Impatiens glandulifera TaxID=253017 RepID=UPI001FB110CD|nr:activating signal cointegrator 1 [Impatiens glandulifera]